MVYVLVCTVVHCGVHLGVFAGIRTLVYAGIHCGVRRRTLWCMHWCTQAYTVVSALVYHGIHHTYTVVYALGYTGILRQPHFHSLD